MKQVEFKLQNIVMQYNKSLDENWWMLNRGTKFAYIPQESCYVIPAGSFSEFFTYFNSFSIAKWKKYTCVKQVSLKLKAMGAFELSFFGHYRDGAVCREDCDPVRFNLTEPTEILVPIPETQCQVVAFSIRALTKFTLFEGSYVTVLPEEEIRDVQISLATTTFKKESYIKRNMDLLERFLFYSGEPAGDHFTVRIVDNGRTLNPEELESEHIHVYPNENVGGAGGFTRGIIESVTADEPCTHVLLMDDDVMILPESLIRTYTFLALLKDEYDDRYLSGAMLYYEHMNIQHEDVGFLDDDGAYGPRKPVREMHTWDNVFLNEEELGERENSYAGWWYCCVPVKKIDLNNLPIPLFIRGDDVEYSVAHNAKFLTLGGICVWHKGFVAKFNAAMELYTVLRNSLIIQAMSGIFPKVDFVERINKFFEKEIRRFNYNGCELLLDALEDFINGPSFMETPQGEKIMKAHAAKNEKLFPLRDQWSDIPVDFGALYFADAEKELKGFKKWVYEHTYNGHKLPGCFLDKEEPAVIAYDWFDAPYKQYLRTRALAVNPHSTTGAMREMDKKTFKALMARYKRLNAAYRRNRASIEAAYRQSAKRLKSFDFWCSYLGIQKTMPTAHKQTSKEAN